MKREHKLIIERLNQYLENHPDQRFGQAIFNLGINEFQKTTDPRNPNYNLRDIYNDSDSEINKRIERQLEWFDLQKRVNDGLDKVVGIQGMRPWPSLQTSAGGGGADTRPSSDVHHQPAPVERCKGEPAHWLYRYYKAQLLRDESMAMQVQRSMRSDRIVVVLAGTGHIEYGLGIPGRVHSSDPRPRRIIVPVRDELPHKHGVMPPGFGKLADFVWTLK